MFYRSSWEKVMMLHLDNDVNVVRYGYERVRIPYYDTDNHKRHYVPDFLIENVNSSHVLCEIKPKQFLDNEKTRLKADAANVWCETLKNHQYVILTSEDLRLQEIL
jgi:predicted P-loop ATPase/GTPase